MLLGQLGVSIFLMAVRARVCAILHKWPSTGYLPLRRLRHVHFFLPIWLLGKIWSTSVKNNIFLMGFLPVSQRLEISRTNLHQKKTLLTHFLSSFNGWVNRRMFWLHDRSFLCWTFFTREGWGIYTIFITKTVLCK